MSIALTLAGWRSVKSARRELRKAGLSDPGFALLNKAPKRRFPPRPAKQRRNKRRLRRKYWYMRCEDFDRLVVDAKALQVEAGLVDGGVCGSCGGSGTLPAVGILLPCPYCNGVSGVGGAK